MFHIRSRHFPSAHRRVELLVPKLKPFCCLHGQSCTVSAASVYRFLAEAGASLGTVGSDEEEEATLHISSAGLISLGGLL